MDENNSVRGRVYIELDAVGAQIDGAQEGGNGVLGEAVVVRPSVGDNKWGVTLLGQVSLSDDSFAE